MATTLDQLNTAIANLDTQVTGDDATIEAALQLIIDDCNQLLNNPPTDFTQQVTSIKATAAKLQAAVDAAKAAAQAEDQKVNPPGPSNAAFSPKP